MAFLTVNWLGIFVAAVVGWAFGSLYYNVLGPAWMAAQGKTHEQFKAEFAAKQGFGKFAPFVIAFLALIVMAWVMYGLFLHMGAFSLRGGIISGAFCWLGFVATTVTVNNAFSARPVKLTVIDAGHWLGVLIIVGAMVGWLGP